MMKQLLGALEVLRDAHVVHCDIKPENILLVGKIRSKSSSSTLGARVFRTEPSISTFRVGFTVRQKSFWACLTACPSTCGLWVAWPPNYFWGCPSFRAAEYDLLSRICETIGMPPSDMLANAPNANKFFTRVDIGFEDKTSSVTSTSSSGDGSSRFKLMSLREFEARSGGEQPWGKKYYKYTEFADIIASIPYTASKVDPEDEAAVEAEKKARTLERSAFYDFLTGLMTINPTTRWTPAQALAHPFITNEPFNEPFKPNPIPERTTPEEREELQRVAAKEAAKVSSGEPVKKKKKPQPPESRLPPNAVPPTPPAVQVGGLAAALLRARLVRRRRRSPSLQTCSTRLLPKRLMEPCCRRKRRHTRTPRQPWRRCPREAFRCHQGVDSVEDTAVRRWFVWRVYVVDAFQLLCGFASRHEQRSHASPALRRFSTNASDVQYGSLHVARHSRRASSGGGSASSGKSARLSRERVFARDGYASGQTGNVVYR